MECVVQIREVYGRPTIYPVNETAQLLARLAGTKTLTSDALDTIARLGYTVTVSSQWADAYAAANAR